MLQNITQEKNCKPQVLNISYFYSLFLKEKKSYAPSLFCIGEKTRKKRPRKVTLQEYKKIVYEYLKIYFFELYINSSKMYFPLGGLMKIVTYSSWIRKQKRGNSKIKEYCKADKAIGLFWYSRPSRKMFWLVNIKKLTGKTNMIPKIEKIFNQNQDKDLLPIFTEERKKGKLNKTLYRCIQT
jgi:hypothetical protein